MVLRSGRTETHCKLSLVVRREGNQLRRYAHIGTGNYHPSTARFYEDLGIITCDEQICEDVSRLFNQLSGYAPKTTYKSLLVAPRSLRSGLIECINREIENHKAGKEARIQIKCNSMVDEAIIDSLYRASQAGVPVDVVVRGICALRPGVPDSARISGCVRCLGASWSTRASSRLRMRANPSSISGLPI